MTKLSVAIATFNEEKNIEDCIKSVSFADEIVVVDGQSSDKTAEIAKKMGAKVYSVPNQTLMKKNMKIYIEKATGDWILSLDADERITPELAEEIKRKIENPGEFVAFQIPRKNLYFKKYLEHTGWYPDYQDRLFKKGSGKFPGKNVHEELVVAGPMGKLEHPLEHLHYETVSQWISKLDKYTSYEAQKLINDNRKITWSDSIRFPLSEFLSRFFDRQGFKDGLHGLVLSILMAFYWELVFAKIWEHQKFWQYQSPKFLDEVSLEAKNISREFNHWQMESEDNKLKKFHKKIKNKIRKEII